MIIEGSTEVTDQNAIERWLKRHQPEAILTEISNMKSVLEQLGTRVPQDIALATLNVLDSDADSGINQNPELVGKAAGEVLVAMINRNERGTSLNHRSATVMGQWVKGSTLPVRTPRKPALPYPEPPAKDSPLRSLPNVVLTPHIAGSMQRECERMGKWMVDELRRFLAGEPLRFAVTREQLARMA